MVTERQLLEISHDVGSQWKTLGRSLGFSEEQIHIRNMEDNSVFDKASILLLMWLHDMEKYATVGLLVDCLREIELGAVAEKLLG